MPRRSRRARSAGRIGHNRGHDLSARFAARRRRARRAAAPAPRPRPCGAASLLALAPAGAAARRRGGLAAVRCWRWLTHDAARPGLLHLGRRRAAAQQGRRARRVAVRPGRCSCSATRSGGWCRWALRAWLSSLARALRRDGEPTAAEPTLPRVAFWVGLALLMAASCCAGMDAAVPLGDAPAGPCRRRARLHARAAVDRTGWALPARACCGSPRWWPACRWRCAFRGCALAERIGAAHRRAARAPPAARETGRGPAHRREAQREREQVVEVERQEVEDHLPLVIEPTLLEVPKSERVAKERQKPLFVELADTKLPQVDLLDAAPGRVGDGDARVAGDDQPADREEAQGLRRRGARGRGLARPGDHALRDRAGHRRQGRAGRQPGQGPGALAVAGEHPRGRDHPRQELHGAGAAQRAAADDPAGRDPGLAGLQRRRLAC